MKVQVCHCACVQVAALVIQCVCVHEGVRARLLLCFLIVFMWFHKVIPCLRVWQRVSSDFGVSEDK